MLQLGSGSTSAAISSAFGGLSGFNDIIAKLRLGARPYSVLKGGTSHYFTFLQAAAIGTNVLMLIYQRSNPTPSWASLNIYRIVISATSGVFSIIYQSGELMTN